MIISNDCPLILSDLYLYDITACYYNILKNIGWDLTNINYLNKTQRNIEIGILQKNNPTLSKFLLNEVTKIIDYYIEYNRISYNNIIVRQRDGFISQKKLLNTSCSIPLDLRCNILRLILSSDRKIFLYITDDNKVIIKGITNKLIDSSVYNLLLNINYNSKRTISKSIESIKQIFFSCTNIRWYGWENSKGYAIPIKHQGIINLNKSAISMIEIEDIDKEYIWRHYIWIFLSSVILTYM